MISIVLVENVDREQVISHLNSHSGFDIQGLGHDGYDALTLTKKHKPDITILNLNLNFYDEIEVSHLLKRNSPETSVVLLGSQSEGPMMKRFIEGQASAYLLKEDLDNLALILRKVKAGEMYVNPRIGIWALRLLAESLPGNPKNSALQEELPKYSRSEIQMLKLISCGCTDKEIANRMSLKDGTVRNYISKFMRKGGFKNRAQVIHYAITHGLSGSV